MQAVKFVEHILTIVLRAVRAILLSIPITTVVVGSIVEAVGFITSHHFLTLTHIVAVAFALVSAYAVALTYATVECVLGAVRVGEILERDFAKQESLIATGLKTLEKTLTRL